MRLSLLIAIILRLFALYWAVSCAVGVMANMSMMGVAAGNGMSGYLHVASYLAAPFFYGILAVVTWFFAHVISLKAIGTHDTIVSFSAITAENFHTLGLLGFGLYHAIGNLATSLNWIHFLIMNRAGQSVVLQSSGHSLYDVTSSLVPCVAGIALAILSPRIAKKLARAEKRIHHEEERP